MIDNFTTIKAELAKRKAEFDIATFCLVKALESIHERLEKLEGLIINKEITQ